jgi:anti-sigma B factor antagonist
MEKMVDPAFGIETTLTDGIPVVSVSGEIDLATAQQLRVSLLDRLGTESCTIVVDLGRTTFVDSAGLGVLVSTLKRCRELGGELLLVGVGPRLVKLLTITGLHGTFRISTSVEAALGTVPHDATS